MVRALTILGATGSVGRQALDVVRANRDKIAIRALTAYNHTTELPALIQEFAPEYVIVRSLEQAEAIRAQFPFLDVSFGENALEQIAAHDGSVLVLNALVGSVGIRPTLAALFAGSDVALANKETLVAAGEIVNAAAAHSGARIFPVDSEHSALLQCLQGYDMSHVNKMILTASGGPFRGFSRERLAAVTIKETLAHPTWQMGAKITVDSATLMNKGLEVIEAHHLFAIPYERIEVIVHPQSIVHSLVEFVDGAMLAQLGAADMRTPIQFALLGAKGRSAAPWRRLDLCAQSQLTFMQPDLDCFPALSLAYSCGKIGGTAPAVMNAANEVAVHSFLTGALGYLGIYDVVRRVVDGYRHVSHPVIEDIFAADAHARALAHSLVQERSR